VHETATLAPRFGSLSPRFEEALCPLCGRLPTDHLFTTRDLGWGKPGEFHLRRCRKCDLILTTPRPVPESMPLYYEDWYNYKPIEAVRSEHASGFFNRFVFWMRRKMLEKTGPLEPDMNLLDVGAGFGAQLLYYIRRRNVRGTAVDFDPTVTRHSLLGGIADVRTGDLLDLGLPANSFDVVTFYETLEHVYEPLLTLQETWRVLKPGGRLVVEVPNYAAPWRRIWRRYWFAIMTPVHLYHFTPDSLQRMVRGAGFRPIRHVAAYVPYESSASMMVLYCALTGAGIQDTTRTERVFRFPFKHAPFFLGIVTWTAFFDLSIQGLMWLMNSTGVQTLIAEKPRA